MYEIFVPVQLSDNKSDEFSADFFHIIFSKLQRRWNGNCCLSGVKHVCVLDLSLLVVLVKVLVLTKWLAGRTSLRTPIGGKEIKNGGLSAQSPGRRTPGPTQYTSYFYGMI